MVDVVSSRKARLRSRHRSNYHRHFASYISFGVGGTLCLCLFLLFYILVLMIISPLLTSPGSTTTDMNGSNNGKLPNLHVRDFKNQFIHVAKDVAKDLPASAMKMTEAAKKLRQKYRDYKNKVGATDQSLLNSAADEFNHQRQKEQLLRQSIKKYKQNEEQKRQKVMKHDIEEQMNEEQGGVDGEETEDNTNKDNEEPDIVKGEDVADGNKVADEKNDQEKPNEEGEAADGGGGDNSTGDNAIVDNNNNANPAALAALASGKKKEDYERSGFMVVGMHRSGTSMLCGLLATSAGYEVGGPLIGVKFDNQKGFYERVDVVLQNDEFMRPQNVWWAANVMAYKPEIALQQMNDKTLPFDQYGKPAIEFFNNPDNIPWLQKDPRMCITIKTWLPLLNKQPAIVWTYRHPLEVAMSLKKREKNFTLEHGLRLWIVYNMRGIQNIKGLCTVYTSNKSIMENPLNEIQRISDELTTKCDVPPPPRRISKDDVNDFFDPSMQHNKKKDQEVAGEQRFLEEFNDGCKIPDFKRTEGLDKFLAHREESLYKMAMRMYCDLETKEIHKEGYEFPKLP